MWIVDRLLQENRGSSTKTGMITGESSAQTAVSDEKVQMCGPWGVQWCAPAGSKAVLLKTDSGTMCLGTAGNTDDLKPGELRLVSQGGAEVYLTASGEVVINGQTFAAKEEK
ncbi:MULTISPECIES: hypothetical protein [Caproicibacterium]|jgi:hypothetical protein|uniref:Baseplate assembly protein n=1 Tax=Caproicibacterium lactatifermentans TaxID=2666138 RepID=A0A859DNN1_9FIRM|nr:hypothetical protein [Caproicibacterium lactatifermentans]ARP49537.1 hypothetical protein B6259_00670 [Ruminococcaceae bacterium CPB6]MDD4807855.1 hypothetical protein [Oscillospiraceae bacterium]QKN23124.1 hypothetical protein GJQ69_00650 [Caproicibacterium lactatifermentans]QKO30270.1 hypothetical protein GKP14_04120 [Caproicibacterium lactatifermentans]